MSDAPCPDRQRLQDYSDGKLSEEESERLAEHVNLCPACQGALGALDNVSDPLVARLRRPVVQDPYEQEPGFQLALARARGAVQAVVAGEDVPEDSPPLQVAELRQIGEYRLLGRLGQGGMGTVYRALQIKLEKTVALKVLSPGRTQDPRALARFEREMKAVGRLNHPNIVLALDAREIEGTSILVMEYVEGDDLAHVVRHHGPLRVPDACELVRQAAVGLQYVHENDLVHRDIKPSNLMLSRAGQVKILDLGLALLQTGVKGTEMTGSEQAMGTADYVSPEQVQNAHNVDIRADIYSLGCTLYKLLAGRAPFGGPDYHSTFEKMLAHVQRSVPPIRDLRPDVAPELAAVLDRMLAKLPDDRYAKPGDVARAIVPFTIGCDLLALVGKGKRETTLNQAAAISATAMAATDPLVSSALTGTEGGLGNAIVRLHDQTAPTAPAPSASRGAGLISPDDLTTIAAGANVGDAADESPLARPTGATSVSPLSRRAGEGPGVRAPSVRRRLAIALGLLGVGLLFGVVIWFKNTRIEVPDRSEVEFRSDGSVEVRLPEEPKTQPGEFAADEPLNDWALVSNPSPLPGVQWWTAELTGHRAAVLSVAFSPDGSLLATLGGEGNILLWDTKAGRLDKAILGQGNLDIAFAWSPDGRYIVATTGSKPRTPTCLWDVKSGRLVRTFLTPVGDSRPFSLAWSPDGQAILAGYMFSIIDLLDAKSGKAFRIAEAREQELWVRSLAWSPDGRSFAVSRFNSATIEIWDLSSLKVRNTLAGTGASPFFAWFPDGNHLASLPDEPNGSVRIWDARTGQLERLVSNENISRSTSIACSPDGARLTWAGYGKGATGVIRQWDTSRAKVIPMLLPDDLGPVSSVAYSPDCQTLAIGEGDGTVRLYRKDSGWQTLSQGACPLGQLTFSPDAKTLAYSTVDGSVSFWPTSQAAPPRPFKMAASTAGAQQGRDGGMSWAAAGLLATTRNSQVLVWNDESAELVSTINSATASVCSIDLSPDGSLLALHALSDQGPTVFDIKSRQLVGHFNTKEQGVSWPTKGPFRSAWSPDGKRLAAGVGDGVAIFDSATGKLTQRLTGCGGSSCLVAWSPDGKHVAAANSERKQIWVWGLPSGKLAHELVHPGDPFMRGLQWNNDGKALASTSLNWGLAAWDISSGSLLGRVRLRGTAMRLNQYVFPYPSPGLRFAAHAIPSAIRLCQIEDGEALRTLLTLREGHWAMFTPEGHYTGSPGVEKELVYVVVTDAGQQFTLTPEEFAKKYGWKNDPEKVGIPKAEGEKGKGLEKSMPSQPVPTLPKPKVGKP